MELKAGGRGLPGPGKAGWKQLRRPSKARVGVGGGGYTGTGNFLGAWGDEL